MAGHSKWSKIKRKKAVADVKKGKILTKALREVEVAARMGGGNPDGNARLKMAIVAARSASVPMDNIERAIKRGSGEQQGEEYQEVSYEGYGPGGVALIVRALTNNRHRTVAEVRHAFSRFGGSLGQSNSVAFLFEERGILTVAKEGVTEERIFDLALEAGADDIEDDGDGWEVRTSLVQFAAVSKALDTAGIENEGGLRPVPLTTVKVVGADAIGLMKLIDALEDLDDVQDVFANFEIDEAELEALAM